MSQYIFLLGNTPELSLAELRALLPQVEVEQIAAQLALATLENDEKARQIMDLSGGLVKITRIIKPLIDHKSESVEKEVLAALLANLQESGHDKTTFGVGEVGRDHLEPLATSSIKQAIIKAGYKARYVESSRDGLTAAILLHKKSVVEMVVIQSKADLYLTQTVAIQDIDRWTIRDREKPYADRKKGMLPPKVARMMVNLALAHLTDSRDQHNIPTIYDPFCGTGTVLIEAILRDCHVVGSDNDPQAVAGTRQNLEWLQKNLEDVVVKSKVTVFAAEVANAQKFQFANQTIDAIVTEPYLGKPRPNPQQVANIIKGLSKLYLGAFRNWTKLLSDGAVVVMVFPVIHTEFSSYNLESLIDKLAPLGYTSQLQPIIYSRPQAVTARQLFVFRFHKPTGNT